MDILKSIKHVFFKNKYFTRIKFENGAVAWFGGWIAVDNVQFTPKLNEDDTINMENNYKLEKETNR